jgi:hypothetical protein
MDFAQQQQMAWASEDFVLAGLRPEQPRKWKHSDVRAVSYLCTHPVYKRIIETSKLNHYEN